MVEATVAATFRDKVVRHMLDCAAVCQQSALDHDAHRLRDRVAHIMGGGLPEGDDITFVALELGGKIGVVPLGYHDVQGETFFGTGRLVCRLGQVESIDGEGASAQHFVLLEGHVVRHRRSSKQSEF
jgi:hypothetical protein